MIRNENLTYQKAVATYEEGPAFPGDIEWVEARAYLQGFQDGLEKTSRHPMMNGNKLVKVICELGDGCIGEGCSGASHDA